MQINMMQLFNIVFPCCAKSSSPDPKGRNYHNCNHEMLSHARNCIENKIEASFLKKYHFAKYTHHVKVRRHSLWISMFLAPFTATYMTSSQSAAIGSGLAGGDSPAGEHCFQVPVQETTYWVVSETKFWEAC